MDVLPWLLDPAAPAVRHLALRQLLDRPADDPDVLAAGAEAMRSDPIAAILAAQDPDGWWVKPGAGYAPKYASTVWSYMFLDQLGASGDDPRIRAAGAYLIEHAQTANGGFGASGNVTGIPPPSRVVHCLNGNLLRALIGFGWLGDERVARAIDWQAGAITAEGGVVFNSVTPGPGFRCGANAGEPCAWGAAKAVLALARIPTERRSVPVERALRAGVDFLLRRDPAKADYPTADGTGRPSSSWFRLGFPLGYVSDVLQVMEALCEAGAAGDPRLRPAIDWLLAQRRPDGRWVNRYPYARKMIVDIDRMGEPSRWVTLRARRVLKALEAAGATPAQV